jgi:hypothetical protein
MRRFMGRMAFATALSGFLALLTVQTVSALQLLTNGDFETGTFAGWTALNQAGGDGSWFIDTPGTTHRFRVLTHSQLGVIHTETFTL